MSKLHVNTVAKTAWQFGYVMKKIFCVHRQQKQSISEEMNDFNDEWFQIWKCYDQIVGLALPMHQYKYQLEGRSWDFSNEQISTHAQSGNAFQFFAWTK
jgi:hypothetical protein